MNPLSFTPDRAISLMAIITKFDDPKLLDAALELVVGISGLNDHDRSDPRHIASRADCARAALEFGYRKTDDCERHCEEYLGIAV
jgi:hypothetical protein